jgi:hypothetical protein
VKQDEAKKIKKPTRKWDHQQPRPPSSTSCACGRPPSSTSGATPRTAGQPTLLPWLLRGEICISSNTCACISSNTCASGHGWPAPRDPLLLTFLT